ncbi:MAG: TIGR00645 family protein [Actinomycetota bacterium]|nr:TIGR00645 family protein [Actinomycetota bacterium]
MTQGQSKLADLHVGRRVELVMEHLMFSSRWLLAPLYLGLLLGLIILVLKFFQEFWHLATTISDATLQETTIGILEILDITLLGNLILIVIFSGYENFVSKITIASESEDRPSWMGKVDFSGLKIKLIGSLVAISVIQLLAIFLDPDMIDPDQVVWMIAIHLTFVISGVLFAVMDFIADKRAVIDLQVAKQELELRIMEEAHRNKTQAE